MKFDNLSILSFSRAIIVQYAITSAHCWPIFYEYLLVLNVVSICSYILVKIFWKKDEAMFAFVFFVCGRFQLVASSSLIDMLPPLFVKII